MSVRTKTTDILWHCTATPEGRDVSYDDLWQWHVVENGWNHIGYHWLIQLDGTEVECRPEDQVGAHCKDNGMNNCSVAIVYAGGMTVDMVSAKDTRTDEQIKAMYDLTQRLIDKYDLTWNDVHGHNEYAAKACPSFDVHEDILYRHELTEGGDPEPGDPSLGAIGLYLAKVEQRLKKLEQWAGSFDEPSA